MVVIIFGWLVVVSGDCVCIDDEVGCIVVWWVDSGFGFWDY